MIDWIKHWWRLRWVSVAEHNREVHQLNMWRKGIERKHERELAESRKIMDHFSRVVFELHVGRDLEIVCVLKINELLFHVDFGDHRLNAMLINQLECQVISQLRSLNLATVRRKLTESPGVSAASCVAADGGAG